ncbi:(2Fe-2S)-binding protein [Mycolicibacterium holsaticum]|uniref:(2Fe-2S)-binding protein n=1 Tax=Mycolicibacterium holsaticum TaxID=152142 RepID=UPI000A026D3F|nr:(2Fe-2S)-binding protein [Mycolicibacterium holsaticum]
MTESLLNTGELVGSGVLAAPGLQFRRRSCCLYYRTSDGGKCRDCALTKTPEAPHPL